MTQLTMTSDRTISLPPDVCAKHGFTTGTPIRIIETRNGILLIPLTKEPMSEDLARELADWQALSGSTWQMFRYEDNEP